MNRRRFILNAAGLLVPYVASAQTTILRADSNIVRNGLLLYVDAGDIRSYPGTGTTWYDLSRNGNDLTFSAAPTVSGGVFVSTGGVYAYRNFIPVDSSIDGYSLEAYFKINSLSGSYQCVCMNGFNPTDQRHMMWVNGPSLAALFHVPNAYNNLAATISTGTSYYLQLSYNPAGGGSNGRRAWLNGVEQTVQNTGAGNVSVTNGTFTIATDQSTGGPIDISCAMVRYYKRALTEAEAQRNYYMTTRRFRLS